MRFERVILGMGALSVVCLGSAAMALDTSEAMSLCSRLSKKARLECYDQVAQDVAAGRLQSGSARAPSQSQAFAPAPAPSVRQGGWDQPPVGGAPAPQAPQQAQGPAGFGAENARRDGPDSINVQVASSTDNGLGQWRMRLADGAVWQMTERVAMFRPPAPNEAVVIRRGAMGSFLMDVGKQGSVRVTRVR